MMLLKSMKILHKVECKCCKYNGYFDLEGNVDEAYHIKICRYKLQIHYYLKNILCPSLGWN